MGRLDALASAQRCRITGTCRCAAVCTQRGSLRRAAVRGVPRPQLFALWRQACIVSDPRRGQGLNVPACHEMMLADDPDSFFFLPRRRPVLREYHIEQSFSAAAYKLVANSTLV